MTAKIIPIESRADAEPEAPISDDDLLGACAAGDRDALGALYDRHVAVLVRFYDRTYAFRPEEIDDLVQMTFVEVWRSATRFDGRSAPRTWILGIGHNLARRYVRDLSRRRAALDRWAEITDPTVTPEPRWQDQLVLQRLQSAMQDLRPEQRVAFVLCDLEGLKGVEAAQVVNVPPGTLWRRLHEARKRLRAALQGDDR